MLNNKIEDLLNQARVAELLHKKELEEKNKNSLVIVLAVIGAIAAVAVIAYVVYDYFFAEDYLDDFDADDFNNNFEDDFIEFSDENPDVEEV